MTDLSKIKVTRILHSCIFWIAIMVHYLESRNLELEKIYQLISIYSVGVVVLEYPTGVIGDYFSHKLSVTLGYFITGISIILLGLNGSFSYYMVLMIFGALGVSLTSGSDTAILHSVSKNFKKDMSELKSLSIVISAMAVALGGFIGKFNLSIPLFLAGTASLIAVPFNILIKEYKPEKNGGNIFARAKESIDIVLKNPSVFYLVLFTGLVGTVFISFKWFFNPYFEVLNIDKFYWGVGISVLTLLSALGTNVYSKIKSLDIKFSILSLVVFLVLTGVTVHPIVSLAGVMMLFFVRGLVETQLDFKLNEVIDNKHRASVISLKNLIVRSCSALYVLIAGYVISALSFWVLFSLTSIVLFCAGLLLLVQLSNQRNVPK